MHHQVSLRSKESRRPRLSQPQKWKNQSVVFEVAAELFLPE